MPKASQKHNILVHFPELCLEWDYKKNDKDPCEYAPFSEKKVWWLCRKMGHSWLASISNRSRLGRGCPYCSGRFPDRTNNLLTKSPHLSIEWHPSNGRMCDYTPHNTAKVKWICQKCKREWTTRISHRVNGHGCPYCCGRKATDINNLSVTASKHLLCSFDVEKNDFSASDVSPNSHIKAWWICEKGHSWKASIAHRFRGRGCPICARGSISESGNKWLDSIGVVDREHIVIVGSRRFRTDGFDQESNTAYEFLGDYWHGNPSFYDPGKTHPDTGKTFGVMLSKTIERLNLIVSSGIHIIYKWEGFESSRRYERILADRRAILSKSKEIWKESSKNDILEILE